MKIMHECEVAHINRSRLTQSTAAQRRRVRTLLLVTALLLGRQAAHSQVGPAEIPDAQLKSLEMTYLPQLTSMGQAITKMQFPFAFNLSRYVGVDPRQQTGIDGRGLEFVRFHDRTTLKVSGNYNAAFGAALLTQNQRAGRVFNDVVAPLLRLVPQYFTTQAGFDRVGFEISYHVRTRSSGYDYEGKEILVVVLDKAEALAYSGALTGRARQGLLNTAEVYVNGKEFGLALNSVEALGQEALAALRQARDPREKNLVPAVYGAPGRPDSAVSARHYDFGLPSGKKEDASAEGTTAGAVPGPSKSAEAELLQGKLQPQLDALGKEGVARYHFVEYAPPSLVLFRNSVHIQMTLRNPSSFDRSTTSIYKRAAQSFDLFLAPLLKPLLERAPNAGEIAGLDITVLNQFGSDSKDSQEAIEFIFPLQPLRQFAEAEITNQDLINQSVVMVNGVRIALDLQRIE